MTSVTGARVIRHIISVQSRHDGIYMVLTQYRETNALNPVGQVLRTGWDRNSMTVSVLNTNDSLTCMWASPAGNLWVGSADGNVWTTADVGWPRPRTRGLDFDVLDAALNWKVTTLPDLARLNFRTNITTMWGISDADVYAATFEGAIYHWDGLKWSEMETGVDAALNDMHGSGKDDIYCVGYNGTILHFDGVRWTQLAYPGEDGGLAVLTGVRVLNDRKVIICGRQGQLLTGDGRGINVLAQLEAKFYGVAHFQDRVILAAGPDGAWELRGNQTRVLKSNFDAVDLFELDRMLIFIEPSQEPEPRVVEYNPAARIPWSKSSF